MAEEFSGSDEELNEGMESGSEMEDDQLAMEGNFQYWSTTLQPGKEVELEEPKFDAIICVTSATFGLTVKPGSRSVVMCKSLEMKNYVPLCVLREGNAETVSLDVKYDGPASFQVKGKNVSQVTLNGYLQPHKGAQLMQDVDDEELERKAMMAAQMGSDEDEDVDGDEQQQPGDDNGIPEDEDDEEEHEEQKVQEKPKVAKRKADKDEEPSPKKAKLEKTEASKKMRKMDGGILWRDMKEGNGDVIRNNSRVTVKYVGQLSDQTVFDKCLTKQGFTFVLGKGEVIKGWDVGLKGCKVGSKRKLIIPPHMAYGYKGKEPSIPRNAKLTFTVEVVKTE